MESFKIYLVSIFIICAVTLARTLKIRTQWLHTPCGWGDQNSEFAGFFVLREYHAVHICGVYACRLCMCICTGACMCLWRLEVHLECCSSGIIHFGFWNSQSFMETRGFSVSLDWLVRKLQGPITASLPPQLRMHTWLPPCPDLSVSSGDWPLALTLAQPALRSLGKPSPPSSVGQFCTILKQRDPW